MKLYGCEWTVYPRRTQIYLAEKNIHDIEIVYIDMLKGEHYSSPYIDINPIGTLPSLLVDDGRIIHDSGSIFEFIEEVYPEPNMIGRTSLERAATRDFIHVLDDAYIFALMYVVHASKAWEGQVEQKADAASVLRDRYETGIHRLEKIASGTEFVVNSQITYADCAFYASIEYLDKFYGEPLPSDCKKLLYAYESFSKRASATPPPYPTELREMARLRV